MSGGASDDRPRIAVLADDLIWATRLADLVRGAGAAPVAVRSLAGLVAVLPDVDRVVVDLTARAYDPLIAIERGVSAGVRVLAVGQHDDLDLRKRALARGAERVLAYRKLFEDGPTTIEAWMARAVTGA